MPRHHRGEADERPAASNGVDDASDTASKEKNEGFEKKGHSPESHGAGSRGRVEVQSPSILSEPSGVRKGFPCT